MAVLFAGMAMLQFNDPDPFLWSLVYGSAAVACSLYVFDAFLEVVGRTLCISYLAGILVLLLQMGGNSFFDVEQMMGVTEPIRELSGLAIAAVWMGILLRVQRGSVSRSKGEGKGAGAE